MIIHLELHAHGRIAGPNVISERQSALPALGDVWAAKILKYRSGILSVDRECGDAREIGSIGWGNSRGIKRSGNTRREWIAGINLRIEDRAALNAAHRTPGAAREWIAGHVAVILRIGIEDKPEGFVLFGKFRFDAAIAMAIARDGNLSLDTNTERIERPIILGHPVVDIDDRRADFGRGRIRVESYDGAGITRVLVCFDGLLRGRERLRFGSREFELHFARLR